MHWYLPSSELDTAVLRRDNELFDNHYTMGNQLWLRDLCSLNSETYLFCHYRSELPFVHQIERKLFGQNITT